MAILTHRLLSEDTTTLPGITGARVVRLSAIAKTDGQDAPYCLANEVVCAELGRLLGLPIPPYTLVDLPAKPPTRPVPIRAFSSLDFALQGVRLPPVDPAECVRLVPDLCAGVALFDVLVINTDRHAGNLAMDTSGPPRLAVYDHSHALLGDVRGQAVQRLEAASRILGCDGTLTGPNTQCLLSALTNDLHFDKWLGRIEAIPDFVIDDLVAAAKELGCTGGEGDSLAAFLKDRRSNVRQIIQAHQASFPGITQWSLPNAR